MPSKAALQRRIAPSQPLTLCSTDNAGNSVEYKFLLCFDVNALTALEEKVPELNTLNMGGLEIFGRMNARVLRAAFWAAILRHHPEYDTADDVGQPTNEGLNATGSLIDSGNAGDVVKALEAAYLATLPKERADQIRNFAEKKGADNADPTPAAETAAADSFLAGQPSTPLPDTISELPIAKSAG